MKQETTTALAITPTDAMAPIASRALLALDVATLDAMAPTTATWTRFATYVAPSGNPIASNPGGEKCHHRRPKELCS